MNDSCSSLFQNNIDNIAQQLSSNGKLVVITQGVNPTLVAHQGTVTAYPVSTVKKELIVDMIGSGDAFFGGFLSQFIQVSEGEMQTNINHRKNH